MALNPEEILRRFVEKYSVCQNGQYAITQWPDKAERTQRACDAYAVDTGGAKPLAIEHTRVESFHQQLQDSARFTKVCGALETELNAQFAGRVTLVIPTFGIQPKQDWNGIKGKLREWLEANVPTLPDGYKEYRIPGVPFAVGIWKKAGGGGRFSVARSAPPSRDDNEELSQIVANALKDKNEQLERYISSGAVTILLLETDDIALMNHVLLYKAFFKASKGISARNISQVWMVETIESEDWCQFLCFHGPSYIMEKVNLPQWMLGREYAGYWEEVIAAESKKLVKY